MIDNIPFCIDREIKTDQFEHPALANYPGEWNVYVEEVIVICITP